MLIDKTVKIKWNPANKIWYENKGYIFTKWHDEFDVNINDLSKGSEKNIKVKCDYCNKILNMRWVDYLKCVKKDGKYYCNKCAIILYIAENTRKTKLKYGKSFEQWCIENNRQDILDRWDYELNDYKPSEIGFSTNKKIYFTCPKEIHKSELKNITIVTSGQSKNLNCKVCKSIAQWGIDNLGEDFLEKYWDYEKNQDINPFNIDYKSGKKVWINCQNKEYHNSYDITCNNFVQGFRCPYCTTRNGKVHPLDSLGKTLEDRGLLYVWSDKNKKSPYEYTPKSMKKVWYKCLNNKHKDFYRTTNDSNKSEFRCPECNDYSKGEERISNCFINKSINYVPQKMFSGLVGVNKGLLSYDFYLPDYNLLIEYQGEQHEHYVKGIHKSNKDFEKQQEHDRRKKEYAQQNNIKLLEIWYWEFDKIEEILDNNLIIN